MPPVPGPPDPDIEISSGPVTIIKKEPEPNSVQATRIKEFSDEKLPVKILKNEYIHYLENPEYEIILR